MKACEAWQVETQQDKEKVPDQVVIQSWIYYVNRDSLILFNILYYVGVASNNSNTHAYCIIYLTNISISNTESDSLLYIISSTV